MFYTQEIITSPFLFDSLTNDVVGKKYGGFPFTDVLYDEETEETIIRIAVAGYSKDLLKVETEKDELIVTGSVDAESEEKIKSKYRERNIKRSNFVRKFKLNKGAYVTGVLLEDGILEISLALEVPEEDKRQEYLIHQE